MTDHSHARRKGALVAVGAVIVVGLAVGGYLIASGDTSPSAAPSRTAAGSITPQPSATPTASAVSTDTGTPLESGPPTTLPPGLPTGPSICAAAANRLVAAEVYVDAAQAGLSKYAQSCVYHNSVPSSVTKSLNGKVFGPQTTDSNASSFVFETTGGGTKVTVHVARQPDGHYYVTGVRTG